MRINKRTSVVIAGVILLVFLVSAYLLSSARQGGIPTVSLERNERGEIEAKVIFGEFRKSETKEGKKLWEVSARTGRYYPESGKAELENPSVELFRGDETLSLVATNAQVILEGATLSSVSAKGNVVITSQQHQLTLNCDEALFSRVEDTVRCPGPVTIISGSGTIIGEELEGTMGTKEFHLKRNVRTEIRRKK